MFKFFKRPKETIKEPTYTMGLYSKGKELSYHGYKRQPLELEMMFENGEVCITNTNVINFENIKHDFTPMVSVIFDKNGEKIIFFYIRHNIGTGDTLTYNKKTIFLNLPDQTHNKHIYETLLG